MQAGWLRAYVTFQTLSPSLDGFGQPTNSWSNTLNVWACINDISGSELIKSMALDSEATTRITVRYRTGITAAMRILHDGVIYNIKSPPIDKTGKKAWLELLCQRGLQT